MKILYRRELHKTTPTNFLYHVRLTYWLPLQLLWAELYLNLKGTQMGSPPVEHRGVSSCCSSRISITTCLVKHLEYNTGQRERVKKVEYNLHLFAFSVFTLNVKRWGDFSVISLQKAETETSVRFSSVFQTPAAASAGHSWLIRDVPSVYGLTRWSFNE